MRRLQRVRAACLAVGPEVGRLLDAALEHAVGDVAAHGPEATLHLGHLDDLLHLAHLVAPLGQPLPRPLVGTCGGGCWASPAASPVGANGRRRSAGSGGRMTGGACIFAPSIWSG